MLTFSYTPTSTPHGLRGNYKIALLAEQIVAAITGLVFPAAPSPLYPPGTLAQHPDFSVSGPADAAGVSPSVTITVPDFVLAQQLNLVISVHDSQAQSAGDINLVNLLNARTSGKLKLKLVGLSDLEIFALLG